MTHCYNPVYECKIVRVNVFYQCVCVRAYTRVFIYIYVCMNMCVCALRKMTSVIWLFSISLE